MLHAINVTSASARLCEEGIHTCLACWPAPKRPCWAHGPSINVKNPSQAPHVIAVKAVFLAFVGYPALAEKGTQHAGPIHCDLGGFDLGGWGF